MASNPKQSVWCVLRNKKGEYLLLKRARGQNNGGQWNFPGGGVEHGEDRRAAGAREFHEEAGYLIKDWKIMHTVNNKERSMTYIHPASYVEPDIHINSESSKYGWFSLKEIRDKNLHYPTLQFFKHASNKDHLEYRKRLVQGNLFMDITASLGDEVIACAKICLPSRKLHNLHVEPMYRGLGYGDHIMNYVMALDTHPIQLTANPSANSGLEIRELVAWYRKFGFMETVALASNIKSGPIPMRLKKNQE